MDVEEGSEPTETQLQLHAVALDHAWKWYESSLNARISLASYLAVVVAAHIAAYVAALENDLNAVAGGVGISGVVFTIFMALNSRRARQRMTAAEHPLDHLQSRLAVWLDVGEFSMVDAVAQRGAWPATKLVAGILSTLQVLALIAASVYAFKRG